MLELVCWLRLVIPAQGRLKQEDPKFETNLGYIIRPCLKTKTNNTKNKTPRKYKSWKTCETEKVLSWYQSPSHTWITQD